jgi:hypothetical protein
VEISALVIDIIVFRKKTFLLGKNIAVFAILEAQVLVHRLGWQLMTRGEV